jgi:hypothetical protein
MCTANSFELEGQQHISEPVEAHVVQLLTYLWIAASKHSFEHDALAMRASGSEIMMKGECDITVTFHVTLSYIQQF